MPGLFSHSFIYLTDDLLNVPLGTYIISVLLKDNEGYIKIDNMTYASKKRGTHIQLVARRNVKCSQIQRKFVIGWDFSQPEKSRKDLRRR